MAPSASCGFVFATLLLTASAGNNDNWESKVNEEGRQVQSMKIEAPSMTEEDQYGYTMPDQYRCDSCKVVVHHLTEALKRKQPKNRRLQEWEYHELFDETCSKSFSGYGVSLVNGQNMLSGPSIKRDNLEAGMGAIQMGGETWEKRLGEICRKFVYEKVGEDEVYDHFRSRGEVSSDLCFSETRDCRAGPERPKNGKKTKEVKAEQNAKQGKTKGKGTAEKASAIDASAFISKLAKKHGVVATEYTKKRSFAEWEQLFLLAAKRIADDAQKEAVKLVEV